MKKRIRGLVDELLDKLAEQGRVWRPEWVTHEICTRYEHLLKGMVKDTRDFYDHCAHAAVRGIVGDAIRKRTDPSEVEESQLTFEGFSRVQAYYNVEREGEDGRVAVPVLQLRPDELTTKIAELRVVSAAYAEHADQLELFFRTHGGTEGDVG